MIAFLLILVLVLMVALPSLVKGQPQLVGACRVGLVVLAGVLMGVRWLAAPPAQLEGVELFDSTNWAVGWRLGQAVLEAHPGGGKLAVLVNDNPTESMVKMAESQLAGLEAGLKGGDFHLEVLRPSGNAQAMFTNEPDVAQVEQFAADMKDAVAIVSFVPFPFQRLKGARLPAAYLFDQFGSGYWKGWMAHGYVAAAAHPHSDFKRMQDASLQRGSPDQRFGAMFELITPDQL